MPYTNTRQVNVRFFAGKLFPVLLLFSVMHVTLYAQTITVHHPQLQFLFEDTLLQQAQYHSIFKPADISWSLYESVMGIKPRDIKRSLRILPVLDANVGYEKEGNQFLYQFGEGVYASGNLGKKAGFEFSATLNQEKFSKKFSQSIDSFSIVPGHNSALWQSGMQTGYASVRGFMFWKPNRWITIKAGNDKNFIGDGARSLLLSENAAAYPFLQTRMNVWKINYIHQVLFMRDILPDSGTARFPKYASMHTLSYNITRKLNFYFFEAIVWRAQDSVRQRGFDVTYLNPFVFFRPVEFNIGSPDNVLMGIGGKWIFWKRSFIYGQFLLDEFNYKEVKAGNKWWANKYAWQVGFKTYSLFKNHTSFLSVEYNSCRPFTYAHKYTMQNYAYLYRSMAHPQGSNFQEYIAQFGMALRKHWFINASGGYLRYGIDPSGKNYGSDLYKAQYTFTKKYGNYIGQGILNEDIHIGLTLSRLIKPAWRLRVFFTGEVTLHQSEGRTTYLPAMNFGLNTGL